MSEPTKFCKDCRYFTVKDHLNAAHFARCSHVKALDEEAQTEYLVNGGEIDQQHYCSTMRGPAGKCGRDGKLYDATDRSIPDIQDIGGVELTGVVRQPDRV